LTTILTYIILRLFVRKKYTLEGDELRHLASAKTFYKLWNNSFYDMHPPLYSWLIRVFRSGVLVSLGCSIGLYYIAYNLYGVLGLTYNQKILALTFLAFNYTLIYYSNRTFRYQLIALLGTLGVYLLLTHQWIAGGITLGLLGLTCTFAGLRGFWIWLLLGANWLALLYYGVVFGSWFVIKARVYSKVKYHPSGIEGMVEEVNPFTFKQLLTPMYFKWNHSYYGEKELGYTLKGWMKRVGGVFGLYEPLHILVPIILVFMIRGMFSSPIWVSLLVLILLYPSLLKRYLPRNSIIAIPFIGFLLAKGIPPIPTGVIFIIQGVLLSVFLIFHHVLFTAKPNIKAKGVSKYLNSLPGDGVIVDGMICQPIAYQTNKRVIVLTREPKEPEAIYQTDLAINEFKTNYAVIRECDYTSATLYIRDHKLIRTIKEDNTIYHVYQL